MILFIFYTALRGISLKIDGGTILPSKIDIRDPDIVQILTFCAYRGTITGKDRSRMVFTGPAVEQKILPLLNKFGKTPPCFRGDTKIFNKDVVEEKWTVYWPQLISEAELAGWRFKKKEIMKVPSYIFDDENLVKAFISTLLDCRGSIFFSRRDISKKIRTEISFTNTEDSVYIIDSLRRTDCPVPHFRNSIQKRVSSGNECHLYWCGDDTISLLNYINWSLTRPRNRDIMEYIKENIEAKELGKGAFL